MTESHPPSKHFKIVHWVACVFLLLMMAQPTFDNIQALLTGVRVSGEMSVEVTFSNIALHVLAMVIGWLGLWWFFKRQKRGAYVSIAAHILGTVALITQTPEMLEVFPPLFIAVFFVILFTIVLGPIQLFKDEYS